MMILVNRPFSDEDLAASSELDLRNVEPKVWPRLLSSCRASSLRLYHITLKSLDGIECLGETRDLTLEWATKIESLEPVFPLRGLMRLSIFDFPKLRALTGIEDLGELVELNLSGSRGAIDPPLRLLTIEPVTRIPKLVSFSLTNARLDDDDITCLSRCSKLRHLHLSNQFDRGQFAFLAKHLNAQLETPLTSHVESSSRCERCGGHKAMFVGRRMPFLCPTCDGKKFERLEHEFETSVRTAV
ncbi:MAG TPA: leucine-rich repeat domain-containing protein [Thermoanaerobaculia bacterium]|nr:leucine-rich repeat domain-containing protein [Thermoanaerobaculia bacterium]